MIERGTKRSKLQHISDGVSMQPLGLETPCRMVNERLTGGVGQPMHATESRPPTMMWKPSSTIIGRSMRWWSVVLTVAFLVAWSGISQGALPPAVEDAVTWYDTLGFPDAKDLPYVRVATGAWIKSENKPPENRFVEGFLVGEDAGGFTVFVCGVSHFKDHFGIDEPYPPLTAVHFVRRDSGPEHARVGFEKLDFAKVASEVFDRVRGQTTNHDFRWGSPSLIEQESLPSLERACKKI